MRVLFALLLAGSLVAAETSELFKSARVAMEAKIKAGDALLQKGDVDGAVVSFNDAAQIFREALAAWKTQAGERVGLAAEELPEEIVDEAAIEIEFDRTAREAVQRALAWLTNCQGKDTGSWDAGGFTPERDGHIRGRSAHSVGVTGLALLALQRAGAPDGEHAKSVRAGLRYLLAIQNEKGFYEGMHGVAVHSIYGHLTSSLAMIDAYKRTSKERYLASAKKAIDYILRARNPYMGWRYGFRSGENDTSVTALAAYVLDAARNADLEVDPGAFDGARAWIDKMTDPEFGQVGYNQRGGMSARTAAGIDKFPPERTQAMTAAGILTRIIAGEDPRRSELIQKGARLCIQVAPRGDASSLDMYYWYVGTNALARVGGPAWKQWRAALEPVLRQSQAKDGTWPATGAWGADGGGVYSTAIGALTLHNLITDGGKTGG